MTNPVNGTYIEGRFYNYIEGSYVENIPFKNDATLTQNSKTFSCQGGTIPVFSIQIALENTYDVKLGSVTVGSTTNLGVSRKVDLESYLTAQGASMPITFVTPYGATYSVVPTGGIDYREYRTTANPDGLEFTAALTLEAS